MNFKFNRKPLKEKIYKWYVCGYYDINARGVEDNLTTNDVEEAKDFAWELVNRGDFVIVKNMHNGKSAIINEDDAFDDVSEYLNDIFRSIDGRRTNEAFLREEIVLNFDRALLDKWIDRLNQHDARYDKKYYYTEGGKYIKVIYTYGGHDSGSVFAFVDADGNIYKPAGWNAPAKGVRARIDDNPPVDGKDLYAPRYRKAVYGESLKEDANIIKVLPSREYRQKLLSELEKRLGYAPNDSVFSTIRGWDKYHKEYGWTPRQYAEWAEPEEELREYVRELIYAYEDILGHWNDIMGESLKEDISDYDIDKVYKKLSKLNKVDFGALEDEYLETKPSVKDAVYKFYGTILNTKRYCKDFVQWAKEERGIDLKGLPCKESYRRR